MTLKRSEDLRIVAIIKGSMLCTAHLRQIGKVRQRSILSSTSTLCFLRKRGLYFQRRLDKSILRNYEYCNVVDSFSDAATSIYSDMEATCNLSTPWVSSTQMPQITSHQARTILKTRQLRSTTSTILCKISTKSLIYVFQHIDVALPGRLILLQESLDLRALSLFDM